MSARILVVDDILPNVKLLEAKLSGEYFDVITATSGQEALDKVESEGPDIILLDIMMPGMDGFEVCERLKANPATAHIPVVMVTALTDATDRVRGLEAGADDFLSKPVNDIALMARVRSLVRLKMTVDEWKIRESTAGQFGMAQDNNPMSEKVDQATILIVEDKAYESTKFVETLKRDDDVIDSVEKGSEAIKLCGEKDYDLIVISLDMAGEDGLRLCSHLRSNERTRAVPILMIAEESEMRRIAQGLDIGAHDYILRPVDRNEFLARVRTQIRRKRFQDKLRANYETSLSMAMMDPLTGLFNRRYLMAHFEKLISRNAEAKKTMGVLMFDLDHFKAVNDTYGHQAGDDVLKTFAERITKRLRSFDLVARMGGEEFVAVLPDISQDVLIQVAERLRKSLCNEPVIISVDPGRLDVSSSIGGVLLSDNVDPEEALKRADDMLYQAKENGRNCVWMEGVGKVTPSGDAPNAREEQMKQLAESDTPDQQGQSQPEQSQPDQQPEQQQQPAPQTHPPQAQSPQQPEEPPRPPDIQQPPETPQPPDAPQETANPPQPAPEQSAPGQSAPGQSAPGQPAAEPPPAATPPAETPPAETPPVNTGPAAQPPTPQQPNTPPPAAPRDAGTHDSGSHDSGAGDSGSGDSGSGDSGSGDSGPSMSEPATVAPSQPPVTPPPTPAPTQQPTPPPAAAAPEPGQAAPEQPAPPQTPAPQAAPQAPVDPPQQPAAPDLQPDATQAPVAPEPDSAGMQLKNPEEAAQPPAPPRPAPPPQPQPTQPPEPDTGSLSLEDPSASPAPPPPPPATPAAQESAPDTGGLSLEGDEDEDKDKDKSAPQDAGTS